MWERWQILECYVSKYAIVARRSCASRNQIDKWSTFTDTTLILREHVAPLSLTSFHHPLQFVPRWISSIATGNLSEIRIGRIGREVSGEGSGESCSSGVEEPIESQRLEKIRLHDTRTTITSVVSSRRHLGLNFALPQPTHIHLP